MKQLKVKNCDGVYYICEDKNEKFYAIPMEEMPEGAEQGDIIIISDNGEINKK